MKTSYSSKFIRSSSNTTILGKTLYLTKIKPTTALSPSISKASTDDLTFGSSDSKQAERSKMLKTLQTQQIWYKPPSNNVYDTKANVNHTQVKQIKDKVRSIYEPNAFDLRAEIEKKKYFSLDYVNAIYESEQIRKKLQVQRNKPKEVVDIYTFRKQNKEICLKNNMIDLLKNEMNKVEQKENDIKTALSLAKLGMERDMKAFDELVINHKRTERERNAKLNETAHYNKMLYERKKDLTHSLKVLQEETERHLREIRKFKAYADFIHLTFNYNNEIGNVTLSNVEPISMNQRDKDFVPIVRNVVKQFAFLDKYEPYHPYILDNPDQLAVFFDQVDGNIRKAINERNALIEEQYQKKLGYDKVLMKMRSKEKELEEDLIKLSQYDTIEKEKTASLPIMYKEQIKENTAYITILYKGLKQCEDKEEEVNSGRGKSNYNSNDKGSVANGYVVGNINDLIKECLSLLYKNEKWINSKQDELAQMQSEQPEHFKKIIEKIKQENKRNKLIEVKEIANKLEEERKWKYLQRMTIYKPYGGVVYPPPQILKRRKSIENKKEIKPEIGYNDLHY